MSDKTRKRHDHRYVVRVSPNGLEWARVDVAYGAFGVTANGGWRRETAEKYLERAKQIIPDLRKGGVQAKIFREDGTKPMEAIVTVEPKKAPNVRKWKKGGKKGAKSPE